MSNIISNMLSEDMSMIARTETTICIFTFIAVTIFGLTNSKPVPYLGRTDHTDWENSPPRYIPCPERATPRMYIVSNPHEPP